jgi:(2Fe-2S) ferredoxin
MSSCISKFSILSRKTEWKLFCLYLGGHKFAGNVIVYPSGTWYGRVLPCHIPLLIDAYTSVSKDFKEKLKPLLRGYLETS